ncbi:hypothetical protein ZOSMA_80G00210 [Zostera marina]|uniref:C3H1-type domain-containing protein n=1 Tax=Zostera marina TaxID=29655 RepID=A0A0K9NMA9_ZOSMR|nr:hypothetical protein ZOSMA_80G00210 [Zostera marina]
MMDGGEITAPDTPPISSSPTTPISTISSSSFLSQTFRFSHNEGDAIDDDFLEKERIRISKMLGDATSNYKYCINLLCRAISEIEALQKEKMDLTEEFLSAKRKLDVFIEGPIGKENMAPSSSSSSMSPVVVGGKRSVPKSISIRSKGFLSIKNTNIADGERNSNGNSLGIEVKHPHRLLVPVTGKEGIEETQKSGVELEVYDQGMAKTELCNKWEEMAWCPYGKQCQFAHGMEELRPVIRHPRYKTQLCRMVTLPEGCPYGHRCHFRHPVSDQG